MHLKTLALCAALLAAPVCAQATAKPAPTDDPAARGWGRRVDLSKLGHGLQGHVSVPATAKVTVQPQQITSADGLEGQAARVRIGGGKITLTSYLKLPKRRSSLKAHGRFHANFNRVSSHTFGPGHWAQVHQWRPGECMIHGVSEPAGLLCDGFKMPCGHVAQWLQVCASIAPGPKPSAAALSPKTAFPKLPPAAAKVAWAVAQAVARNDAKGVVAHAGPKGLKVGKRRLSSKAFVARAKRSTVLRFVARAWAKAAGSRSYTWNARSKGNQAVVYFSSGYGKQPIFVLDKRGAGWHLSRFDIEDLGEP